MDLDSQTPEDEHLESIPWSQLMVEAKGDRPMLVYVAAAALVALVVGVVLARGFGQSPRVEANPAPSMPEVVEEPVLSPPISEADLRAPLKTTDTGRLAAIAQAEWFVTDYFTSDGAGDRDLAIEGALGWKPPAADNDVLTYVERAQAWDAGEDADGRYRVLVAYRAISKLDGVFQRGPVRGVAVPIQIGADGIAKVVDLPEPVSIPKGSMAGEPFEVGSVPELVADAALDLGQGWGEAASVVGGTELESAWRVLVKMSVPSGSWPLVIRVDK